MIVYYSADGKRYYKQGRCLCAKEVHDEHYRRASVAGVGRLMRLALQIRHIIARCQVTSILMKIIKRGE